MRTEMSIVSRLQQDRMTRYRKLIAMATCDEERKAYEVSRLIHIKDPDIVERSSWLLEKK